MINELTQGEEKKQSQIDNLKERNTLLNREIRCLKDENETLKKQFIVKIYSYINERKPKKNLLFWRSKKSNLKLRNGRRTRK